MGGRQRNFDKIIKTGENMIKEGHVEDPEALKKELDDLTMRWEALCTMSVTKQERLMNSLVLAKEMQSGSQALMRRLHELEGVLKIQGPIADEIAPLRNQIDEFQVNINIYKISTVYFPLSSRVFVLVVELNPGIVNPEGSQKVLFLRGVRFKARKFK